MICLQCGDCCRYMLLPLPDSTKDQIWWLSLHEGVTFEMHNGRMWIRMPIKCKMLDGNGKCMTYHDRPNACKNWECNK